MNEHSHKVIIQIEPQQRAFLHKIFDLAHESGMLGHGIAIAVKADTPNDRKFSEIVELTCAIRNLTANISEAEATASPTAAAALQEARGHLLRASMAVERVQKGTSWKDVADDLITKAQAERGGV